MKAKISSIESIMDIAKGYQKSRVLLTAIELDIFTVLGKYRKTSKEISNKLSTNHRATDRLLNALTAMDFLKKTKNYFSNTPVSQQYLDQNSPTFLWHLKHAANQWDSWATLTKVVQTGKSVTDVGEKTRDRNRINAFIHTMHDRAQLDADTMVSAIDISGISNLLDVGGGSGAYAMAFVKQNKNIRAVVFDRPDVIPLTKKFIKDAGLSGQIHTISGDYHRDNFGSGYDLVLMSAIIHINTVKENIKLIKKGADVLNQGGRLVIQDFIMENNRTGPEYAALFALNMLTATSGGDTYTKSEIQQWMKSAGLIHITRKDYGPHHNLMIGRKL